MHAHHKKELHKLLSRFKDEDLFNLIWATNILQTENYRRALPHLDLKTVNPKAVGIQEPHEFAIHKWELETLANEGLTTPPSAPRKGKIIRMKHDHYGNIVACINRLRKLENKEFSVGGHKKNIFGELVRIGNRQFPWQVGSANMANLYRNNFVYGQGKCAEEFRKKFQISITDFSKVSFALHASLMSRPSLSGDQAFKVIGVSEEAYRAALRPLCLPLTEARRLATTERRNVIHVAYKPSIFRQYPCINFSGKDLRIRSPLPQLIMDRMTTGLFYDVVSGGGPVRDEYGRRFEEYCLNFSQRSLPELSWQPEEQYKLKKSPVDTPDILCFDSGSLILVAECKATRMSREAMFGQDPTSERGFADLVKAVKQIWRFFAHCRLGKHSANVNPDAVGMVITLDNWLVMAEKLKEEVFRRADREIASFSQDLVRSIDKRRVIFTPVQQYERVMSTATKTSFTQLLSQATATKHTGWNLDMIHEEVSSFDSSVDREFPFIGDIQDVVPWWNSFAKDS
ncbi:hypothetical protein SAMN05444398_11285 [Roseovarius pacificus]|uniref:Uncharacterized protein n=1 Tax=Roseovarius pacificus TaxID=337701 RepID=A0A1M7HCV3_9RHOB|nr:hypothetical protein [Roseovarius pacificus]SHM26183.1 hypothetical protein SAMN05444398_11285 [Roseovarius pacificus]